MKPPAGGPVWSDTSEDLNATVLAWNPGGGPPAHVNPERDVLVAVLAGSATALVGDERHELVAGDVLIIPKGRRRALNAGARGVRYLSAHRRRPALQIRPLAEAGREERREQEE
ncbi:MAG: cupin domain-containing protein [Thermoleophilia bacterium]|nr:cupin domain-containing protein [Thermoleophilia bacterium]